MIKGYKWYEGTYTRGARKVNGYGSDYGKLYLLCQNDLPIPIPLTKQPQYSLHPHLEQSGCTVLCQFSLASRTGLTSRSYVGILTVIAFVSLLGTKNDATVWNIGVRSHVDPVLSFVEMQSDDEYKELA
jgi:hypothetical protein